MRAKEEGHSANSERSPAAIYQGSGLLVHPAACLSTLQMSVFAGALCIRKVIIVFIFLCRPPVEVSHRLEQASAVSACQARWVCCWLREGYFSVLVCCKNFKFLQFSDLACGTGPPLQQ